MDDLIVEHLRKEYPTPTEPLQILHDISFRLSAGESLAIVGPSGSGKSTLLQILGTLDQPTSGQVTLRGENPFQLPEDQLAKFRNRRVGFVFQDHHLLPQLTAWENVVIPALANGAVDKEASDRAAQLLDRVGLGSRQTHRPAELSGGERQRVAIARALLFHPCLILADEPTGNLDATNAAAIVDLLLELQGQSVPAAMLIVVTHSSAVAHRLQRCCELDAGRLRPESATSQAS